MRSWALLLVLVAPMAEAAFLAPAEDHPDLGRDLPGSRLIAAAFADANGNGLVEAHMPDEPLYLDVDSSRTVTYGDIRLTAFASYAAGTVVDVPDRDVGRVLTALPGWLARDGDAWYLDGNNDARISVGDLRFTNMTKVPPGDAALGQPLRALESKGLQPLASGPLAAWVAETDTFTSGHNRLNAGDLILTPTGFAVTAQAIATEALAPASEAPAAHATPGWRTLDWILVMVGLANLAGMVIVGRIALARHPKNPF